MNVRKCTASAKIYSYRLHAHPTVEIVCQIEGETRTEVGDRSLTLHPGEILLIPAGVPHRGVSDGGFRDLALCIRNAEFDAVELLCDSAGTVTSVISVIARLLLEQESGYEAEADLLAQAVCRMIADRIGASRGSPDVERVRNELYANLSRSDLSVSELIARTGYDKDYFRRRFKKETGKTPSEYLTDLRMTYAKELLSDQKHLPVKAIAESCGFSDSLYFSTCFKRHCGMSPLAYRKSRAE